MAKVRDATLCGFDVDALALHRLVYRVYYQLLFVMFTKPTAGKIRRVWNALQCHLIFGSSIKGSKQECQHVRLL